MYWLSVLLIIPMLWVVGFLLITDFTVPRKDIKKFRRVLVIFPHADDEVITCGGFLHRLSRSGATVTLVILTKGERGTPDATRDDTLKAIRVREAQASTSALGIANYIQEDLGDGDLYQRKPALAAVIAATIEREKPDLLLTYDLAGFYGHADHIACSEVVTDLHASRFPEVALWYATFPKIVLSRVSLPPHMESHAEEPHRQSLPTHKIFIGASVFPKTRAWYAYKSQRASMTNGVGNLLPIWFFFTMVLFEYIAEVP